MGTNMIGIGRSAEKQRKSINIQIPSLNKYSTLAKALDWSQLAEVANFYREKHVSLTNGRPLNLRLHLGAYITQSMNGLTDRTTEDHVRYHAGTKILCGTEDSGITIDHTSIEVFRNTLGEEGASALNKILIEFVMMRGFTNGDLCSSDTTVQESPIAYPTEVGHLKKITSKLVGIGKKIKKGVTEKVIKIADQIQELFNEIRLFTKGTKEKSVEKKKELGEKMRLLVTRLQHIVEKKVSLMTVKAATKYQENLELYKLMIEQIEQWQKTGYHPKDKLISLWDKSSRAITRNKLSKNIEFGVRWIITRLTNGYIIGNICKKIGADADTSILEEVLINFVETMNGKIPSTVVYDRGGDGPRNHEIITELKIPNNCIFRKGKNKMNVGPRIFKMAKRERALSEASISVIKQNKYGFNKPRARSSKSCITKGHMAILGANINKFIVDLSETKKITLGNI